MKKTILLALLLCIPLSSFASEQVATRSGQLTYLINEDQGYGFKILLNQKIIYVNDDSKYLDFKRVFNTSNADVVLVEEQSGGTACEATYRLIIIKANGQFVKSSSFGNCSTKPNIKQSGDVITIKFPKIGPDKSENISYNKGVINYK